MFNIVNESFVENREMNGILKEENIKMTSLKWEKIWECELEKIIESRKVVKI